MPTAGKTFGDNTGEKRCGTGVTHSDQHRPAPGVTSTLRPGYSLAGCSPAEPASASPGSITMPQVLDGRKSLVCERVDRTGSRPTHDGVFEAWLASKWRRRSAQAQPADPAVQKQPDDPRFAGERQTEHGQHDEQRGHRWVLPHSRRNVTTPDRVARVIAKALPCSLTCGTNEACCNPILVSPVRTD